MILIGLVAAVHLETGDLRFFGWNRGDSPESHVARFMFHDKDVLHVGHFAIIGYKPDVRQLPKTLDHLKALDPKWLDEVIGLYHKYFLAQNVEKFEAWLGEEESGLRDGVKARSVGSPLDLTSGALGEIRVVASKWRDIKNVGKGA